MGAAATGPEDWSLGDPGTPRAPLPSSFYKVVEFRYILTVPDNERAREARIENPQTVSEIRKPGISRSLSLITSTVVTWPRGLRCHRPKRAGRGAWSCRLGVGWEPGCSGPRASTSLFSCLCLPPSGKAWEAARSGAPGSSTPSPAPQHVSGSPRGPELCPDAPQPPGDAPLHVCGLRGTFPCAGSTGHTPSLEGTEVLLSVFPPQEPPVPPGRPDSRSSVRRRPLGGWPALDTGKELAAGAGPAHPPMARWAPAEGISAGPREQRPWGGGTRICRGFSPRPSRSSNCSVQGTREQARGRKGIRLPPTRGAPGGAPAQVTGIRPSPQMHTWPGAPRGDAPHPSQRPCPRPAPPCSPQASRGSVLQPLTHRHRGPREERRQLAPMTQEPSRTP